MLKGSLDSCLLFVNIVAVDTPRLEWRGHNGIIGEKRKKIISLIKKEQGPTFGRHTDPVFELKVYFLFFLLSNFICIS